MEIDAGRPSYAKATEGRHYMNKMFGAGLERARRAEEEQGRKGGSVARISIEPLEGGRGHRVVVERHSVMVGRGGDQGRSAAADRSEHEFERPEDALSFLHDILHGHEPEQSGQGRAGAGGRPGGDERASEGDADRDDWGEEQDSGSGDPNMGSGSFLSQILGAGRAGR